VYLKEFESVVVLKNRLGLSESFMIIWLCQVEATRGKDVRLRPADRNKTVGKCK